MRIFFIKILHRYLNDDRITWELKIQIGIRSIGRVKMENECFNKDFEIHYYEINRFQEASPVSIMNYLQEAAIAHSESVGCGVKRLLEQQRAWVLVRWNLKAERYPMWGEKINVKTWPSRFEKCFATREFVITDEKDNEIMYATSSWVFLDTEKRKPVKVPEELANSYGVRRDRSMEDVFKEEYCLEKKDFFKQFSVRKSEIDTNEHVNNVNYLAWILETLPIDLYNNYLLKFIDIRYKKELLLDDNLTCFTQIASKEENGYTGIHLIASPEGDIEFAKAKTVWLKDK